MQRLTYLIAVPAILGLFGLYWLACAGRRYLPQSLMYVLLLALSAMCLLRF
jgi:hypothetical protein